MVKNYKLTNLDCGSCAAKIERGILKLDGVNEASISFMTQRLTLDADESKLNSILSEAKKICDKIEPGCTIVA